MTTCKKLYGAPGTGKTHMCTEIIKENLKNGIPETDILYTTYRREAASDAVIKIAKETGIKQDKLKRVVNTTHGICLSLLLKNGLVKTDVNPKFVFEEAVDIPKFNKKYGYSIKSSGTGADAVSSGNTDPFLHLYSVMRSTRTPINQVYKLGIPLLYPLSDFKQIVSDLEEWKSENGKLEFADMIDIVIKEGICPDCTVQIYDEYQDATSQMYTVSKMWADNADYVVLAGDHLQTLYPYLGANPKYFLEWDGELEVIPKSRRLTAGTWKLASSIIINNTQYKVPEIQTRAEKGNIRQMNAANLDHYFANNIPKTDTFHLVRANYMGGQIAEKLACAGIPFSGISYYSWTAAERNLFNAVQAIRTFRPLKKPEFCAIVDRYPTRYTGAPSSSSAKEEYKSKIESGERTPTMSTFSQTLIESIKSKKPLELSNIKNKLTMQKITGAMGRGWQAITKTDIDRVKILTIHGSKGMQATTNFLHTGITGAINRSMMTQSGKENEAFVWYVGVTRTIDNLIFVNYNTNSYTVEGVCA